MNCGEDLYLTPKSPGTGLYKEKGSKFFAYAWHVRDEAEIKTHLEALRQTHHAARHHCYAWVLGTDVRTQRANDDGEPANSAGKPILSQIEKRNLTQTLVVVIRYFGGTKLGVGGLINAYRTAAEEALENSGVSANTLMNHYLLEFPYEATSEVMRILKERGAKQYDQTYGAACSLKAAVPRSEADSFPDRFGLLTAVKISFLFTG